MNDEWSVWAHRVIAAIEMCERERAEMKEKIQTQAILVAKLDSRCALFRWLIGASFVFTASVLWLVVSKLGG